MFGHIHRNEWNDWRWQLRHRIRTFDHLREYIELPVNSDGTYRELIDTYRMSVTPYFLSLMNLHDADDPLRLQCIPDERELQTSSLSFEDPLHEDQAMPVPDLIHRYPDRCLAMVTSACAVYCRHCNRKRRWKNGEKFISREGLLRMARYVESRKSIREVIISGGDPLMMNLNRLGWIVATIRAIDHVEIIRIGTRIPVVLPMRVDRDLCALLRKYRPLWVVTQFNHPGEITSEAARACEMLLDHGLPVCNQSVLLKGINDSYEVMKDLCLRLQRISVKPYYLFHCEPVLGTGHFHVEVDVGRRIMGDLWGNVSGLCIPRYVYDRPGGDGKVPLESVHSGNDG
jgi:lysine 2,3-aminomutase